MIARFKNLMEKFYITKSLNHSFPLNNKTVPPLGLRAYIAKRTLYSFVLILFVITFNFIIFMMLPGDPTQLFLNPLERMGMEERIKQETMIREVWGLAEPIHVRYAKYLRNLLTWNLGTSITSGQSVASEMLYRLPYTILLLGLSTVIAIVVGVTWGAIVAHKRGSVFDSGSVVTSLVFYSLPVFWLGMVLIWIFFTGLHLLPRAHAYPPEWGFYAPNPLDIVTNTAGGAINVKFSFNLPDVLACFRGYFSHLLLPLTTLVLFMYGGFLLLTRATMLETLTEDYVITARAKGLKERTVLYKHALKNASLPLITSAALSFGFMISGAIITETVFSYPGVGRWLWTGIMERNYQVGMGVFYVIGVCVILANFLADLIYGIVDPRIKYG